MESHSAFASPGGHFEAFPLLLGELSLPRLPRSSETQGERLQLDPAGGCPAAESRSGRLKRAAQVFSSLLEPLFASISIAKSM